MPALDNPRHERFARLTAMGRSRGDAYVLAGYKDTGDRDQNGKRGSGMFNKYPAIQARVEELTGQVREDSLDAVGLDREYVIRELKKNHERCATPEPVIGRDGQPNGEFKFNAAGSNKALELLGKELGMFADHHVIEHLDSQLEGMDIDQLRTFVAGLAADVGLRVVGMAEDETREWIKRAGPRVGLRVVELRLEDGGQGSDGAETPEDGGLSPVS